MRRLALCLLSLLAPFLVCNSYPTTSVQPDTFYVVFDGGSEIGSTPETQGDGSKRLHYDLASLPDGSHSVVIYASKSGARSVVSDAYIFRKGVPAKPVGKVE